MTDTAQRKTGLNGRIEKMTETLSYGFDIFLALIAYYSTAVHYHHNAKGHVDIFYANPPHIYLSHNIMKSKN